MAWKCFWYYWPFVSKIHQWFVDFPHKNLMFLLLLFWISWWPNIWVPIDLRYHDANDITEMSSYGRFCHLGRQQASRTSQRYDNDVIMGVMASQITSLTIVYSIVYLSADQRKHQSSQLLAFVRGIHRSPVNSPHKWPVTRKMFPFDDVIMACCSHRAPVPVI